MKTHRPILAALLLVAWLFAGAHMALEHGGDSSDGHAFCAPGSADDDHDSAPAGEHHHHELGAVVAGKTFKLQEWQPVTPAWTMPGENLIAHLIALLSRTESGHNRSFAWDAPPDGRASGWLLVCHSALPVRGPSLAA